MRAQGTDRLSTHPNWAITQSHESRSLCASESLTPSTVRHFGLWLARDPQRIFWRLSLLLPFTMLLAPLFFLESGVFVQIM